MPVHYLYLILAILTEVGGTSALKPTEQFTRVWPSVAVVVCYSVSFFFLGLTLKYMPVGIVYAIWAGMGIVLIALVGRLAFGQVLDTPAVLGIAFIVVGVVIINLFSKSTHG